MVDPLHHFSPADRARIHQAVTDARRGTSAKFEFVAVPASDHYALYSVVWAAVAAVIITGAVALARPSLGIGTGFVINAVSFLGLSLILDIWPIRIRLVPKAAKRFAAHRMAQREFATHLISKDKDHNGVMLFVSLAERQLEIIAERDAHNAVATGAWDRIVSDATAAMRARGPADGLVGAIAACGKALAVAFPVDDQ